MGTFIFFGQSYQSFFIGNGCVSFEEPELVTVPTQERHFDVPRISALFTRFNRRSILVEHRFADGSPQWIICFHRLQDPHTGALNSFHEIKITWDSITTTGIVGLAPLATRKVAPWPRSYVPAAGM